MNRIYLCMIYDFDWSMTTIALVILDTFNLSTVNSVVI